MPNTAFNATDSQTCNYNHDDLSRISTANCGAIWGQTFTYDAFGNITKTVIPGSAGNSFQPTYSSSTNRITAISGFTPTYDHNGNVLNDNSHIYAMDADNKAVTIDGIGVTYDAMDRMVEQNRSGVHTQIVYAATGEKFALMSGQTLQKAFVPLPGGGVATYNGSGLLYYGHSDHLGSFRVGSSTARTVSFDLAYAPFGETYALLNSPDTSFTGQRQDTSTGLYDFLAREYSNQGRWSTPDPAGLAAASIDFPQTWNRYAYVGDNPLVFTDPLGLFFGPCQSPYNGLCGGACEDGDVVCSPCDSPYAGCANGTPPPPPNPGQCDYVQCGNSGGGSSKGGGSTIGPVKPTIGPRKPVVCSANALIFGSLEFSFKVGLEANLGNFAKIGGSFFRNLTTGTAGAPAGLGGLFGYQIGTENPPGVPITTPAGPVTHTFSVGPLQRNVTTGQNSLNFSFSLVVGFGGEVAFKPEKFNELISSCDIIVN